MGGPYTEKAYPVMVTAFSQWGLADYLPEISLSASSEGTTCSTKE
jgi:hypothetical protein